MLDSCPAVGVYAIKTGEASDPLYKRLEATETGTQSGSLRRNRATMRAHGEVQPRTSLQFPNITSFRALLFGRHRPWGLDMKGLISLGPWYLVLSDFRICQLLESSPAMITSPRVPRFPGRGAQSGAGAGARGGDENGTHQ